MNANEPTMIEIKLSHQDTEAGWMRICDRFYLAATPKWFEWLSWVLVLAAFQYLSTTTGSMLLRIIPAISTMLLWKYFNAFFARLHISSGHAVQSPFRRFCNVSISGTVAFGFFVAAYTLAHALAQNGNT